MYLQRGVLHTCWLGRSAVRLWAPLRQVETPLEVARGLSEELGCTLLLKREDLQPVRQSQAGSMYTSAQSRMHAAWRRAQAVKARRGTGVTSG